MRFAPKNLIGWTAEKSRWFLWVVLSLFSLQAWAAPRSRATISEIVVTNYVGNDNSDIDTPEYIARTVLRADGSALYFGNPTYAPRTGQFKGSFAPSYFAPFRKALNSIFNQPQRKKAKNPHHDTRTEFEILRSDGTIRHLIFYSSQPNVTLNALDNMAYGPTWKIKWQPYVGVDKYNRDLSGVRGDVIRGLRDQVRTALGVPSSYVIPNIPLSLQTADGKEIARSTSDRAGGFCIVAPPGNYFLVPKFPLGITSQPHAAKQPVIVNANGFSDVFVESMPKAGK